MVTLVPYWMVYFQVGTPAFLLWEDWLPSPLTGLIYRRRSPGCAESREGVHKVTCWCRPGTEPSQELNPLGGRAQGALETGLRPSDLNKSPHLSGPSSLVWKMTGLGKGSTSPVAFNILQTWHLRRREGLPVDPDPTASCTQYL